MSRSRLLTFLTALAALVFLFGACVSSSDRDEVSSRDSDESQSEDDSNDRSEEDDSNDDSDSNDDDSGDDDDSSDDGSRDDPPVAGDEFEWNGDCSEVDGPCEYGDDEDLDQLWDECADGDGQACDDLFYDSPVDSQYEEFGNTCGGRGFEFSCADADQ